MIMIKKEELQTKIIASMIEQGFAVTLDLTKDDIRALQETGCTVNILDEDLFGICTCEVYRENQEEDWDVRKFGYESWPRNY